MRTPRDNLFVNGQMDYALTLDQTLRFGYNLNALRQRERRRRRLRSDRARPTRPRTRSTTCACSTTGRSDAAPLRVRACKCSGRDVDNRSRRREAARSASTTHSRAAARRSPAASTRVASTSDPISTTCAACTRCAPGFVARLRVDTLGRQRRTTSAPTRSTISTPSTRDARATTRAGSAIRGISLSQVPGRVLRAGRHPSAQEPHVERRRPLRGADARRRLPPTSAASSASRGRRSRADRPRCAAAPASSTTGCRAHLRADAARRRLAPAGAQHPESVISRSRQRRHHSADQPLPAGRLIPDAPHDPLQRRRRSGTGQSRPRRHDLQLPARRAPRARTELECAGGRRASRSRCSATSSRSCPTRRRGSTSSQVDANINPGALLPAFKGPRISWKRTTVFVNYALATLDNNTDGAVRGPGHRRAWRSSGALRRTTSASASTSRSTIRSSAICS